MQVTDMAHVIQLSVAPVFLLTGVGAMLSVLTLRFGRIIDRTRLLEGRLDSDSAQTHIVILRELAALKRRARLANWAVSLCTICALSICTVIVALFVGVFTGLEFSTFIALSFIFAMIVLILALLLFLQEVYLAACSIK